MVDDTGLQPLDKCNCLFGHAMNGKRGEAVLGRLRVDRELGVFVGRLIVGDYELPRQMVEARAVIWRQSPNNIESRAGGCSLIQR